MISDPLDGVMPEPTTDSQNWMPDAPVVTSPVHSNSGRPRASAGAAWESAAVASTAAATASRRPEQTFFSSDPAEARAGAAARREEDAARREEDATGLAAMQNEAERADIVLARVVWGRACVVNRTIGGICHVINFG